MGFTRLGLGIWVIGLALQIAGKAAAEAPAANSGAVPPLPQNPGTVIQPLDRDFFSSGAGSGNAPVSPPPTAGGRYPAENADYNSEQRSKWIQTCSGVRETDSRAYADCYQKEKQRDLDSVKKKIEAVEKNQANPFRNQAANPAAEMQGKEPAFGGVLEEKD